MFIRDFIPEGWAFCTADFSVQAATGVGYGNVMLVRDKEAKQRWMDKFRDVDIETTETPPLYASAGGDDFMDALRNACRRAAEAVAV